MFQFPEQQNQNSQPGDRLVERVMSAEYNLAVQRNDGQQAMNTLARLVGFLMSKSAGR